MKILYTARRWTLYITTATVALTFGLGAGALMAGLIAV